MCCCRLESSFQPVDSSARLVGVKVLRIRPCPSKRARVDPLGRTLLGSVAN